MKKFLLFISSLSVLVGVNTVSAATIDFESVITDEFAPSILADGFTWDFTAAGWFIGPQDTAFHPDGTSNGTSALFAAGGQQPAYVDMTEIGGGAFDLFGLDAATANTNETNSLRIEGTFFGGGTISTTLSSIDGTYDPYLLSGFVNLVSVRFISGNIGSYNDGGFSIDNLQLDSTNPVPEPATILLFGAGLAGLAAAGRRKKVN